MERDVEFRKCLFFFDFDKFLKIYCDNFKRFLKLVFIFSFFSFIKTWEAFFFLFVIEIFNVCL